MSRPIILPCSPYGTAHSCIVNSRALTLSGLDASTPDPSADIWGANDQWRTGRQFHRPSRPCISASGTMPRLDRSGPQREPSGSPALDEQRRVCQLRTEGAMGPGENTREVGAAGIAPSPPTVNCRMKGNSPPGYPSPLPAERGVPVLRHPGSAILIA